MFSRKTSVDPKATNKKFNNAKSLSKNGVESRKARSPKVKKKTTMNEKLF